MLGGAGFLPSTVQSHFWGMSCGDVGGFGAILVFF